MTIKLYPNNHLFALNLTCRLFLFMCSCRSVVIFKYFVWEHMLLLWDQFPSYSTSCFFFLWWSLLTGDIITPHGSWPSRQQQSIWACIYYVWRVLCMSELLVTTHQHKTPWLLTDGGDTVFTHIHTNMYLSPPLTAATAHLLTSIHSIYAQKHEIARSLTGSQWNACYVIFFLDFIWLHLKQVSIFNP